ncbi:hypothetical protein KA037_05270 [Patescibacteria group bacterium]|nr:hypothetical protein [Patescibacteria group bacterium]MBP7842034.1 hypothetical protein [Patescibacteria group bacterium]
MAVCLLVTAWKKYCPAPEIAHPKRGPIVNKPDAKLLTTSLPALAVTMALLAQLTAGP